MSWILDLIRAFLEWIRRLIEWILSLFGGGGPIADDKCCVLARRDKECNYWGAKSNFSCPEGHYRQWWYCCEGTQMIGCGECTTNTSTCWSGSFACSIWWWSGTPC